MTDTGDEMWENRGGLTDDELADQAVHVAEGVAIGSAVARRLYPELAAAGIEFAEKKYIEEFGAYATERHRQDYALTYDKVYNLLPGEEMLQARMWAHGERIKQIGRMELALDGLPVFLGEDDTSLADSWDGGEEDESGVDLAPGLFKRGHNVLLVAEKKAGKTTFCCELGYSLVGGKKFLGRWELSRDDFGTLGFWNMEMTAADLAEFHRSMGMTREQAEEIAVRNLRGIPVPVIHPEIKKKVVEWLVSREVGTWVIDSWVRLLASCGLDENKASDVNAVTAALDEIKVLAGVHTLIVIHHGGHSSQAGGGGSVEGRGSTALPAWADSIIQLSLDKENGRRYIKVSGRWTNDEALKYTELMMIDGRPSLGLDPGKGIGESSGETAESLEDRVLAFFWSQGGKPASKNAAFKVLRGTRTKVQGMVDELVAAGKLVHTAEGYVLARFTGGTA